MTELRTVAQIDAEIAEAKAELANVHGTETEVYARIVGYYRSVRNWNRGKRDEYDLRKQFVWEGDKKAHAEGHTEKKLETPVVVETTIGAIDTTTSEEVYYEYFNRKTCPNCGPVKKYLGTLAVHGISVDVDTPEGLENAASKGVLSAPTVIAFNAEGTEIGRAHDVSELVQLFPVQAECVA